MKKTIIGLAFLTAMASAPTISHAQFWKNLVKAAGSIAVGVVESRVGSAIPEEHRAAYNDMTSSFNSSIGVDASFASAGSNFQQGKRDNAIIDLTEGMARSSGMTNVPLVENALGVARAQNDYKNDIASGMSQQEAAAKRKEAMDRQWRAMGETAFDIINPGEAAAIRQMHETKAYKDMMQSEEAYRTKVYNELVKRGYSPWETPMYLKLLSSDPSLTGSSVEETVSNLLNANVGQLLDNYNIVDRTASSSGTATLSGITSSPDNSFFGTPMIVKPAPVAEPKPTPKPAPPVDPSAGAKKRLAQIAPDRYIINHVGLNKNQKASLDEVVELMAKYPNIRIRLNGNTCDLGSDYVNGLIGTKRANKAKEYLVEQGIDENRIEVATNAASQPAVDGQSGENRMQNRRVSITVIDDKK